MIDVKRLHQGNNFGKIRFISEDREYVLHITVRAKTNFSRTELEYQRYIAKIYRLYLDFRLKKVGRTTRPFRYDLNQIPYDHTVEMKIDSRG